jgi:alpha-tubulin suppressor-like RCC1 family protein
VPGLTDVIDVAAGEDHTCAVRRNGQIVCWGRGDYGELGDGQKKPSVAPVVVGNLPFGLHLGAGAFTTCAVVSTTTKVQCWGQNNFAQLGTGNTNPGDGLPSPPVIGLTQIFRVSTGEHTCAWRADGKLFCWGRNDFGQVGIGRRSDDELAPVEVTFPSDAGAASP